MTKILSARISKRVSEGRVAEKTEEHSMQYVFRVLAAESDYTATIIEIE